MQCILFSDFKNIILCFPQGSVARKDPWSRVDSHQKNLSWTLRDEEGFGGMVVALVSCHGHRAGP